MTTRSSLIPGSKFDGFNMMPGLLYGQDSEKDHDAALQKISSFWAAKREVPILRPLMAQDYGRRDGWYDMTPPDTWGEFVRLTVPHETHVAITSFSSDLRRPTQPTTLRVRRDGELIAMFSLWGHITGVVPDRQGGLMIAGIPLAPILFKPGQVIGVDVALTEPKYSARLFLSGIVVQRDLALLRPEEPWVDPAMAPPVVRIMGGRKGAPGSETANPQVRSEYVGEGVDAVPVMVVGDRPPKVEEARPSHITQAPVRKV